MKNSNAIKHSDTLNTELNTKKTEKKEKNVFIRITVYCVIIVFLITIVNLQLSMNSLEETIEKQDKKIIELEDDVAEYEMLLDEEKDDEYYERRARKLNYHFRGDIIFYNDYAQ